MYIRPDEIRRLHDMIEIGSHAVSHPNLAALSEKNLEHEIITSKKDLENICKSEIHSFAYPYGKQWSYSEQVISSLTAAGYNCGLTTNFGKISLKTEPFCLPRIGVGKGLIKLKLNLMGIKI